jgi:hypothetical protein
MGTRNVGVVVLPIAQPVPADRFYPLGLDEQLQAGDEVTVRGYTMTGGLRPVDRTVRIANAHQVPDPRPGRTNRQVVTAHVTAAVNGGLNEQTFLGAPVLRNGRVIGLYAGTPDGFSGSTVRPGTVLYIAPLTTQVNAEAANSLDALILLTTLQEDYELAPDGTLRKKDGNPPPPPPGGAGAAACLVGPGPSGSGRRVRSLASLPDVCADLPTTVGETTKLELPFSDDHPVVEVGTTLIKDGKPLLVDGDGKPLGVPGETWYTAREATMPRFRTAVSGGGVEVTVTRPSVTAAGHSLYGYRVYYATSDRWDDVKSVDISSQDDDKGSATIHPTAGKVTFVTVVPKIYDHIWQTAWPVGVKNDKPLPGDESNMVAQLDPPIVGWKS